MMHYGIPNVFIRNNATITLRIHIFCVAVGMGNIIEARFCEQTHLGYATLWWHYCEQINVAAQSYGGIVANKYICNAIVYHGV